MLGKDRLGKIDASNNGKMRQSSTGAVRAPDVNQQIFCRWRVKMLVRYQTLVPMARNPRRRIIASFNARIIGSVVKPALHLSSPVMVADASTATFSTAEI